MLLDQKYDLCIWLCGLLIVILRNHKFDENVLQDEHIPVSVRRSFPIGPCSMSLVFMSRDRDVNETIYLRDGLSCEVKDTFAYVHRGAGVDALKTAHEQVDMSISNVKVVRTDIEDGNLFGFATAFYFRYKYAVMIDVDQNRIPSSHLINSCLERLVSDDLDVIFDEDENPSFIVTTHISLRRFILYTNIKYSNTSAMKTYHDMCQIRDFCRYHTLRPNSTAQTIKDTDLPIAMKCEQDFRPVSNTSDYALLLPTYKRNTLQEIVEAVMTQIEKPKRIIVFQNTMGVSFDLEKIGRISSVPMHHFWCTNWNSFFFMTYMSTMFIHEYYFVKMDDDHIPASPQTLTNWIRYMREHPNEMIGQGGAVVDSSVCNCKLGRLLKQESVDHVAYVTMMYSWLGKVMHRFDTYTYMHGEDIAISVTSYMECGVTSFIRPTEFRDMHETDNMSHNKDSEFVVQRQQDPDFYWNIYCLYIRSNYVPKKWKKFKCRGRQPWEALRLPA